MSLASPAAFSDQYSSSDADSEELMQAHLQTHTHTLTHTHTQNPKLQHVSGGCSDFTAVQYSAFSVPTTQARTDSVCMQMCVSLCVYLSLCMQMCVSLCVYLCVCLTEDQCYLCVC